ncbi:MAG: hypothetical protein AB1486_04585 [Planctomycetota bacterium]
MGSTRTSHGPRDSFVPQLTLVVVGLAATIGLMVYGLLWVAGAWEPGTRPYEEEPDEGRLSTPAAYFPRMVPAGWQAYDPESTLACDADAALCAGSVEHAIALYREAVRRSPDDLYSLLLLACVLTEEGNISEACRVAARVVEKDPTNGLARHLVATLERAGGVRPTLEDLSLTLAELLGHRSESFEFDAVADVLRRRLYAWRDEHNALLEPAPDWRTLVIKLFLPEEERGPPPPPLRALDLAGGEILGRAAYAQLCLNDGELLREDVIQAIEEWRLLDPGNAVPEYLLAHALDRMQLDSLRALRDDDDMEEIVEPEPFPTAAVETVRRAAAKNTFESYAGPAWDVAVRALQERGDSFAALRLGSPDRALLGVYGNLAVRLVIRLESAVELSPISKIPIVIDLARRLDASSISYVTRGSLRALLLLLPIRPDELPFSLEALLHLGSTTPPREVLAGALSRSGCSQYMRYPLPIPSLANAWARSWLFEEKALTERWIAILQE